MRYRCKLLKATPNAPGGREFTVSVRPSPHDKDEFFISEANDGECCWPPRTELGRELFAAFNSAGWVQKTPDEESLYEMRCLICGGTKLHLYYDLWIHKGHETRGASIDLWGECVCGHRFPLFKCIQGH